MAVPDPSHTPRTGRFGRGGDVRLRDQRRQALIASMLSDFRGRDAARAPARVTRRLFDRTRRNPTDAGDGPVGTG